MRTLRLLTLNIWNLNQWRARRAEVAAWLAYLRPDVIALQEVVRNDDGRCQAVELADPLGYEVGYGPGSLRMGERAFGNAILSRFPIVGQEAIDLPALDEGSEGRVCLRVDLDTPRGLLPVYTTHLNWMFHHGRVREAQVLEVAAFVDRGPLGGLGGGGDKAGPTAEPVIDSPAAERRDPQSMGPNPAILMGDFNTDPESTEVRFLKGLATLDGKSFYMQDAYEVAHAPSPGWTWDNRNPFAAAAREPDGRIDYIFIGWRSHDGAGQVLSARVVCDRPLLGEAWPTDHLGVMAEIAYP